MKQKQSEPPDPPIIVRPFFSVVMPLHNKRNYLHRAIESVLNQTLTDFELIVVDDASTDGGAEVVASIADHRIRLLRREEPGPGGYAARNVGAAAARAQWLTFLDADDEWQPNHLSSAHQFLLDYPDVEFLFFGHRYTERGEVHTIYPERRERLPRVSALSLLSKRDAIHTNSIIVKDLAYQRVGGFPAGRCKRGGDSELWVRLIMHSQAIGASNEVTSIYHKDASEIVVNSGHLTTRHPVAETVAKLLREGNVTREERYYLKKIANRKSFQWSRARKADGMFRLDECGNYYLSAFSPRDWMRWVWLMIPR